MMQIQTTRFGAVTIEPTDVLRFPAGLFGLELCRHWVLMSDAENDLLGWLQSTVQPEVALAVVSPRRFVPDYQVRVLRQELASLELSGVQDAQVLVIVGQNDRTITLNLKAPLLLHLERRLGRQVVNNAEVAIQHELFEPRPTLRKSA
ncbi:MAG: flagellar assembly protein FliW [Pirellulales bacterium]|nr:flagellar assembly protein FliW [Pirellulales bacterium]